MTNKINRRLFLSRASLGMGALALGDMTGPFLNTIIDNQDTKGTKKLFATTDYTDNLIVNLRGTRYGTPKPRPPEFYHDNKYFMDRRQLDDLHQKLASLGVTRHQWMFNPIWTLYDDYPHGFDLLEEAAKSAHNHGIEFYAIIKLFENGGSGSSYPHTLPLPPGAPAFKDIRGIFPSALPFAAKYPWMNLKRRPGTHEYEGPLTAIRLVKSDDRPTRVKPEHLTIWTSSTNNNFQPYTGPVKFRESVEWRNLFPLWKECQIIHLEGLDIPIDHRYILVRCSLADNRGDFGNEYGSILELVGPKENIIPHILSTGQVNLENNYEGFFKSHLRNQISRYLKLPEVQAEINDLQKMQQHYTNFYTFGEYVLSDWKTIDGDGYIAAALGKPEYMLGNLHPIYPEVREHWLDLTRFCLERGVDGINYRTSNHTRSPEYWEYGFNEPVLEASGGKTDYATIRRINGDSYTNYLREAKKLIKSYGKGFTMHVNAKIFNPDDRPGRLPALPPNFEWQWETWIREIADELEFRGAFTLRPWHQRQVMDLIGKETLAANKPLYYQGAFHRMTFEGPFNKTSEEIDIVNNHEALSGLVLYETAYYTLLNEQGGIDMSPSMKNLIESRFARKACAPKKIAVRSKNRS